MTLIAHRAGNHRQKPVDDDEVDDRRTPAAVFDPLHQVHRFTLDVAASPDNAKLERYFTRRENGLVQSWARERVWCNPPYSRLAPWLEKAWQEVRGGGCPLVVLLLPANRCEQPFWQQHIEPYRDGGSFYGVRVSPRFLAGRPRFGWPAAKMRPTKGDRPPFGLVVCTLERAR